MKTRLTKKTYNELKKGIAELKENVQATRDALRAEDPGRDVANQMYITLASLALLTGQLEFIKQAYDMTNTELFKQCSLVVQDKIVDVLKKAISKKGGAL